MGTMNLSECADVIRKTLRTDHPPSLFLIGPPGVGKTAVLEQVAAQERVGLFTFDLPSCEAIDIRGLLREENGRAVWVSPLPREGRGIILLDDVSSAPREVQTAAHHVVWAQGGAVTAPAPGWSVVLTGNRATDRTVYTPPTAPFRNRITYLRVEPNVDVWAKWALENGIAPEVVGFLRWRPEMAYTDEIPADGPFRSFRSWATVSQHLSLAVPASVERELIEGAVDEGAAKEFLPYLRTARERPSIEAILRDPAEAPVPSSPSVLYAVTTALAVYTRETGTGGMQYVRRLPAEFAYRYILDIRDHYDLKADADVRVWVEKHKTLFVQDGESL